MEELVKAIQGLRVEGRRSRGRWVMVRPKLTWKQAAIRRPYPAIGGIRVSVELTVKTVSIEEKKGVIPTMNIHLNNELLIARMKMLQSPLSQTYHYYNSYVAFETLQKSSKHSMLHGRNDPKIISDTSR